MVLMLSDPETLKLEVGGEMPFFLPPEFIAQKWWLRYQNNSPLSTQVDAAKSLEILSHLRSTSASGLYCECGLR